MKNMLYYRIEKYFYQEVIFMPNFFDKLNANLTNAGRTASQKLKNSNDVNKLKREIDAEKRNIQEKLAEIGRICYDACKDAQPDEAIREPVDAVRKSEQRIIELQNEIQIVNAREPELVPVPETVSAPAPGQGGAMMICPNCHQTYEAGNIFCAVCGQKLTAQYQYTAPAPSQPEATQETPVSPAETPEPDASEVPAQESASVQYCPECGEQILRPSQIFCANCGHKL